MITWQLKNFNDLTPGELYAILQLRNEVFVVEQNCIFQDADDKDQQSFHLMGWQNTKLVAYTRITAPVQLEKQVSVGRVVTAPRVRGTGLGKELMTRTIKEIYRLFGPVDIHIGGQLYLKKFYSSLGFKQTSEIYLEDGIEHIEMILEPQLS